MTEDPEERRLSLSILTLKTVIVHTITYFVAGFLAYTLGGYEKAFSALAGSAPLLQSPHVLILVAPALAYGATPPTATPACRLTVRRTDRAACVIFSLRGREL